MNEYSLIVSCPQCGTKNRIPERRWRDHATCGKCKSALPLSRLFPDQPLHINDFSFHDEVVNFPGPVLVQFGAPW